MKLKKSPLIFTLAILLVFLMILTACKKDKNILTISRLTTATNTRVYYIAAEEIVWDYAPTGINQITGIAFGIKENTYLQNDTDRIGKKYIKAVYREYTDASFTQPKVKESADMGLIGPVIRAEVNDSIKVIFKNKATFPFSIHPHGVVYDSNNEGITGIAPGATFIYQWAVTENSGPGSEDGSSVGWIYHSHVMEEDNKDIYAGLVGAIVIYRKGYLDQNKPKDMDKEKFALFMIMDENNSLYLSANKAKYTLNHVSNDDPDFQESNLKHSVNGLMYGNCKFTAIKANDKVRWYVMDLGNELDNHTAHWHGNTVTVSGGRTDVLYLGPANLLTADMNANNTGSWQFHCHVNDHLAAGMIAMYEVN
ncbi:multicopper oxidase domain-containing protein [Mucilaginibacter sp. HC2]|jgi:FtsP/CotA-like multicopper oxidase with cupredoxin domain|uniref:multicopper oxidase domain-containing protein n=1 Tax=Mucilaginibacter TaxID=423349 RepID=UPI000DCE72F6|nr:MULTISPECIES: multicopper oxidase domain-containing protein [Mucilaginibacter]NHA05636.1 multicopper oxidase domain-containing protein [Mucilaginibacter inviolabilis]QTE35440.1 multicopper oxidase domain-containing protein [Mucilaginibacter gossypii]RAV59359.1 copper oxidase [Mucilaginibacter rubeus]